MFKFALLAVLFAASVQAGMIEEGVEATAYKTFEQFLIAEGKTPERASCIVKVMKATGATDDVTNLRNILDPEKMVRKLSDKADFADLVCSPGFQLFAVLVVLFSLCACCQCCCRSKKPTVIHMIHPRSREVPYKRQEDVC